MRKYSNEEIFCENSKVSRNVLKKQLLTESHYIHKCNLCYLSEWRGKKIVLEIEHKNGNGTDNRKENLEWLCPNCHSLTPTWRGRNIKGHGKEIVKEEEIIRLIPISGSIREVLLSCGLAPYGGNYIRVKRIIEKYDLKFKKIIREFKIINPMWRNTPRPNSRKVKRPSKEMLEELVSSFPMTQIGRKYGVTDNCIRKWCGWYGLQVGAGRGT